MQVLNTARLTLAANEKMSELNTTEINSIKCYQYKEPHDTNL